MEVDARLTSLSVRREISTMASQAPTSTAIHNTDHNTSPGVMPSTVRLARYDTGSSTESARLPHHGNSAINISGVCPSCHHHHRSLQVYVKISDDSIQVGDVHCKKCRRLWLAFGNANATRLSLLSTMSIEPDPTENEFRSTLIHMIRSITPIAALSPTLTVIPEATSAIPSRETSVRSTARRGARGSATNNFNDTMETSVDGTTGRLTYNRHSFANGRRMLSSVTQRARARLFTSRNIPFGLGRWFSKSRTLRYRGHQQGPACAPIDAPPITAISPPSFPEHTEAQEEISTNYDPAVLDVCLSSRSPTDALASLKALDPQDLQNLSHEQRISWARKQLTDFRARHFSITAYTTTSDMETTEGPLDRTRCPPSRPHSVLAYVGGGFNSYEDWNTHREGDRTLNGRPLSLSETHTSDADTLVDDLSISSTPHHIFVEALNRDNRRSLSPRPLSMRSAVQDARRSIDSTVTGGAVRSITVARNHAYNRLSRSSMHRASSVYGVEPTASWAQFRVNEEAEEESAARRPRSPSPQPPIHATATRHPQE